MSYFTFYASDPQFKLYLQLKFRNFGGKTTNGFKTCIANDRYLYKCLLMTCTIMLNYQKRIQYFLYILVHTSFRHQTILAWIEWISSTMLEKWRLFTSYRIFIVLLKNVARNELQSFLRSYALLDLYSYVIEIMFTYV